MYLKSLIPDENGYNKFQRTYNTMIKRGFWTTPESKNDFEHYTQKVWKETRKQPLYTLKNIEKRGHANKGKYHLDHKFSIKEGFNKNIPIHIIGNIKNLEMVLGRNNISKGKKCSTTINEILKI